MTILTKILTTILALCIAAGPAWGEEVFSRPSDQDLRALVKMLQQQERSFERALDSKFQRSVLRGPGGEIDVDNYLDDLEVSLDRLGSRFTGAYSASTEAREVLERADFMNSYVRDNPDLKGANEWDVFGSSLQRLAAAYHTTFPLPADAQIRRIGDGELADAASSISKFTSQFDSVLRKSPQETPEQKAAVTAARESLKSVSTFSRSLSSRIRSGKPATAEARQLMGAVAEVQSFVDNMSEDVVSSWEEQRRYFEKINQAFGL